MKSMWVFAGSLTTTLSRTVGLVSSTPAEADTARPAANTAQIRNLMIGSPVGYPWMLSLPRLTGATPGMGLPSARAGLKRSPFNTDAR